MQSLQAWMRRLARVVVPAGMYVVLASFSPASAAPELQVAAAPVQAGPGPLSRLKSGNERFVRGLAGDTSGVPPAGAETPFAMVLSCADARMAPELIFGAGPGDLYAVRSLGTVVDRSVLASLEYAVETWQVPLLVVMGHESCAVVKAAHSTAPATTSANLEHLYKAIRGSRPRPHAERQELREAILANVEEVINHTLAGSETLRAAVTAGQLQVVGAYYEAAAGTVVFSDPVSAATAASR